MTNEELKPIEEIKNGNGQGEPKPSSPVEGTEKPMPASAPQPPDITEPIKTDFSKPITAPLPPSNFESTKVPEEPGKKSVIKRTGSEGGWVKYLISAIIVLILAAGVFYYFFYRVTFVINPSPTPDKVTLDNNQINPGTYRVKPGVHTLVIEKKGYITYSSSKKYSFGEKVPVNFKFQSEIAPALSVEAGRFPIFSSDKRFLFFLDKNSAISVMDLSDKGARITPLSNGQYPTTKILKISKDKNFAILLDNEAVKVINFNRTDLVNQSEIKLPPLVSAIHALAWNNSESDYFPTANSKIIYDLKTSAGWDVYLSNLAHNQVDIILQINETLFPSLNMDWGDNPNKVLISGGELGVLDVSKRDYQKVPSEKQFIWGKWGPDGRKAIAVDSEGGAWALQDTKLEKLPFSTKANQIDFIDSANIAAISSGRPIKYNFDTKKEVNYAEVKDLPDSISFIARDDVFYFETVKGIFSSHYDKPKY